MIPFLDLKAPHVELREEIGVAISRVLDSGWYIGGAEVAAFEADFAAYCGVAHCVGVANGLDALVLDVKVGSGAFMKTLPAAQALARSLVTTAKGAGTATAALITDMSEPLAAAAGNALEVVEVMETLTGQAVSAPLWDLTVALGGEALVLAGLAGDGWRRLPC